MPITRALPIVRRVGYALGACLAWLPLAATFTVPISAAGRIVIVGLGLLAILRPEIALLVVAALVAVSDVVAPQPWLRSGALRGPETLVLLFLGGWFLTNAIRPRAVSSSAPILRAAAIVFAALIVASMLVAMAPLQARSTFPGEYVHGVARSLATSYLKAGDPGELGSVLQGAWLLEGVALFFAARILALRDPRWRDACVRMLIVGAAAAGALAIERFGRALLIQADPAFVVRKVLNGEWRLPAHVGDVNAAGSGFILGVVLALGYLAANWRRAIAWAPALVVILSGLLISASRSAIVGGLAVLLGFAVLALRGRAGRRVRVAGLALLAAIMIVTAAIVAIVPNLMVGSQALASLKYRWTFAQTSLRIIALAPATGIGVGRYREFSPIYTPPEVPRGFRADNAHNYFLQVAAELGIAGLIAFAIIVWTPVVRGVRVLARGHLDPPFAGLVGASAVFLITTFAGHPFLIPAVVFPFWIVLGVCAAAGDEQLVAPLTAASTVRVSRPAAIAAISVAATFLSVPPRVRAELRHIDFTRIAYGVYDWEESQNGFRFRWTGPRARFFVPASARLVEIPVRALHFDPANRETTVDIALDGRPANHLVLGDAEWRQVRLLIPPGGSRFRRIDFTVAPTWSPADVSPHSGDRRRLGVIVGEIAITKQPPSDH